MSTYNDSNERDEEFCGWGSIDPDGAVPAVVECDDFEDETECEASIDDDDWITNDGCTFREAFSGKLVLDTTDMTDAQSAKAAARVMRKNQFYPNVWYVSDHGNISSFTF